MLFRLPRLAIAAALAFSIGLHWTFLQSVAWVGMVVNYSQDRPLGEALVKTFDGNHPCALCKEIAKGKQTEKKAESLSLVKKLEFPCSAVAWKSTAPSEYRETSWPQKSWAVLALAPPVPPPRQVPG